MRSKTVVQAEAMAWMLANPPDADTSVITSLPDVSEWPDQNLEAWRAWFILAVRRVIRWVPKEGVAIFYQSDIRHGGAWIDKGYLVMRAAEEERSPIAWHKIVCRKRAGTVSLGRPGYSHMICVGGAVGRSGPDVLPDAGLMPWSQAMGVEACRVACAFLREATTTRVVVDPFCGRGTVLAVANAMGFDAVGVENAAKRCRAARAFVLSEGTARDAFVAGARLFDEGAFWDAHEAWEGRWRIEIDPKERLFLQGLIQIAAAFHKLVVTSSPESAVRLFAKGLSKLESWPEDLDLGAFHQGVSACAAAVGSGRFDRKSIPSLLKRA